MKTEECLYPSHPSLFYFLFLRKSSLICWCYIFISLNYIFLSSLQCRGSLSANVDSRMAEKLVCNGYCRLWVDLPLSLKLLPLYSCLHILVLASEFSLKLCCTLSLSLNRRFYFLFIVCLSVRDLHNLFIAEVFHCHELLLLVFVTFKFYLKWPDKRTNVKKEFFVKKLQICY